MDGREILEIVTESWLNQPSANEASISAYREMGRKILGKLRGQLKRPVSQEDWEILLIMNEAKSKKNYFHASGSVSIWDEFRATSLLFLFSAWETAAQYLYAHYDDTCPETEELKKAGSKKELKKMIDRVTALIQAHISELTEHGQVDVPLGEFKIMDEILGSVMLLILGRKGLETFVTEFNETLPILRKILSELSVQNRRKKFPPGETSLFLFYPNILFYPKKDRTIN